MAVVTVFVRIEEDREHQNRERVKSRRHVRELRVPARASQALVRELWRSGSRKRRKGIGCRKRQKIRRQARRTFNAALESSLAREWRRRRSHESMAARRLAKAWRKFRSKKAVETKIAAEKARRKVKEKAAMMSGSGACPSHTGCFCVLWRGEWFAPPDEADKNNLRAVNRPRTFRHDIQDVESKFEPKDAQEGDLKPCSPARGIISDEDGSPIEHRKKRKKKGKKNTKKGR